MNHIEIESYENSNSDQDLNIKDEKSQICNECINYLPGKVHIFNQNVNLSGSVYGLWFDSCGSIDNDNSVLKFFEDFNSQKYVNHIYLVFTTKKIKLL